MQESGDPDLGVRHHEVVQEVVVERRAGLVVAGKISGFRALEEGFVNVLGDFPRKGERFLGGLRGFGVSAGQILGGRLESQGVALQRVVHLETVELRQSGVGLLPVFRSHGNGEQRDPRGVAAHGGQVFLPLFRGVLLADQNLPYSDQGKRAVPGLGIFLVSFLESFHRLEIFVA